MRDSQQSALTAGAQCKPALLVLAVRGIGSHDPRSLAVEPEPSARATNSLQIQDLAFGQQGLAEDCDGSASRGAPKSVVILRRLFIASEFYIPQSVFLWDIWPSSRSLMNAH